MDTALLHHHPCERCGKSLRCDAWHCGSMNRPNTFCAFCGPLNLSGHCGPDHSIATRILADILGVPYFVPPGGHDHVDLNALIARARSLRETECPPVIHFEGDRGLAHYGCSNCAETRTTPHTWRECAEVIRRQGDSVLDAFTDGSTEEKLRALYLKARRYIAAFVPKSTRRPRSASARGFARRKQEDLAAIDSEAAALGCGAVDGG